MKVKSKYTIRINFPSEFPGYGDVTWYEIIATSEESAIRKAKRSASRKLKATIENRDI